MLIQVQLHLLISHIMDTTGKPFTVADVARGTGLTQQTLLNLLHGRADNPRLDTLQQLCEFYNISMDYFNCANEAQCLHFLAVSGRLGVDPDTLRTIEAEAETLSAESRTSVLAMLEWRLLAQS